MVNFEKTTHGDYKVIYDNGVYMGDLSRAHDLLYNFWPELSRGGFWPIHVLQNIIDKLNELNKPIEEEYNQWCKEHERETTDTNDSSGI